MTGKEIYKTASAFLYEGDGEDAESKVFSIPFLNLLLQETLPAENSIRLHEGGAALAQAPLLTSLETDIPYHDSITRGVLPYGLAALFFEESTDNYRGQLYRSLYDRALAGTKKYVLTDVVDVYGG